MSIERIDNNNDSPKAKDQPKKKGCSFKLHNLLCPQPQQMKWKKKESRSDERKKKRLMGKIDRRCNVLKTYKIPCLR